MEEVEDVGDLRRERLPRREHLGAPGEVLEIARRVALGEEHDPETLAKRLEQTGYAFEPEVQAKGQAAWRGGGGGHEPGPTHQVCTRGGEDRGRRQFSQQANGQAENRMSGKESYEW